MRGVPTPYRLAGFDQEEWDYRALTLGLIATGLLFSFLLLIYFQTSDPQDELQTMSVIVVPETKPTATPELPTAPDPTNFSEDVGADEPAPSTQRNAPLPLPESPPIAIQLTPPVPVQTRTPDITLPLVDLDGFAGRETRGIAGSGIGGAGNGDGNGGGVRRDLTVSWAPGMNFDRLQRYYPRPARTDQQRGLAVMECTVLRRARVRNCDLIGEYPERMGFGVAALDAEHVYRIHVHDQNGDRVYNERIIVNAHFLPSGKKMAP